LQLQRVSIEGAFVLGDDVAVGSGPLHFKIDVVAVHFAVGDFLVGRRRRRSSIATAAATATSAHHHSRNGAGELSAILFQCDGCLTGGATVAARRFIGTLAGYVSSKRDARTDNQKSRYKNKLFGHEN